MRYLKIQSAGEIDVDSFTLLGNSTKRDNPDQIGRFGSGLKYAIAKLLELDISFAIFSGNERIRFKTKEQEFRGDIFDVIYINNEKTNFTTQMGPDWGAYDCIREFYANAVDEGLLDFSIGDEWQPQAGRTSIFIAVEKGVEEIVENKEYYFSFFRDDLVSETGKLKIYESVGHLAIYKQGFLVHEDKDKEALFNYDYADAKINESRKLDSLSSTSCAIATELLIGADKNLTQRMKNEMDYRKFNEELWEFSQMDWWTFKRPNKNWSEAFTGSTIITTDARGFYEDHAKRMDECFVMPERLAKSVRENTDETRVYGGSSNDKSNEWYEKEPANIEHNDRLQQALDWLNDIVTIPYPVKTAKFRHDYVMGTVDTEDAAIVVSVEALDKYDKRQIAEIILEEFFHLESQQNDNTRGFQNYLIRKVIKYMELYKNCKNG